MTKRQVSFSDLSGQMAGSPDGLIPLVVTDYPDSDPDQRKRIEVTPDEMTEIGKLAIAAVGLETEPTNEDERRARFVVPLAKLAKLATVAPLDQVLADADPVNPPSKPRSSNGNGERRSHNRDKDGNPLVNYGDPQFAGLPHNGKIGKKEQEYVHTNLEAVNEKRVAAGHPPINPANREDAERYGFPNPTQPPASDEQAPTDQA
jgi:hypothetical protein